MAKTRYEDRYVIELRRPMRGGVWLQVQAAAWAGVDVEDRTLFRSAAEADRWARRLKAEGEDPVVCYLAIGVPR